MTIDTINRTLQERFAAELPDCYQRRIIFWFDSDREFETMLDELEPVSYTHLRAHETL